MVLGQKVLVKFAQDVQRLISREAKRRKMLDWPEEKLQRQIKRGDACLIFSGDEVIGYVGLAIWKRYVEIGALVVKSGFRKQGLGTRLVLKIRALSLGKYPKKQLIILPNKTSYPISAKLDFLEKDKKKIKSELWQSCKYCLEETNFPQCHCRLMVYKKPRAGKED